MANVSTIKRKFSLLLYNYEVQESLNLQYPLIKMFQQYKTKEDGEIGGPTKDEAQYIKGKDQILCPHMVSSYTQATSSINLKFSFHEKHKTNLLSNIQVQKTQYPHRDCLIAKVLGSKIHISTDTPHKMMWHPCMRSNEFIKDRTFQKKGFNTIEQGKKKKKQLQTPEIAKIRIFLQKQ